MNKPYSQMYISTLKKSHILENNLCNFITADIETFSHENVQYPYSVGYYIGNKFYKDFFIVDYIT